MFNRKGSFVPAALILASFLGVSAANAQDNGPGSTGQICYTLASIQGVYVGITTPASTRVRAADCILARGNQGLENEDLDVRLAALERAAELAKAPGQY